jgi:putative PIN family toxin of toxin-antitoxin system
VAVRIVVDTNVLVAAMISARGANRSVLRVCFEGKAVPVLGEALFLEYEAVLSRTELMARSPLNTGERMALLEAFLSVCEWVDIYFGWRPNLRDEGDNHLIELAVAGGADWLVTNNITDFEGSQLRFPQIRLVRPEQFLKEAMR